MTNELGPVKAGYAKALLQQGFNQHQVAAFFDVNPRAINHLRNGHVYPHIAPDYNHGLPLKLARKSKFDLIRDMASTETID